MKTTPAILRNQFVGCLGCLRESYGDNTNLFDLPKAEFDDSGSYLSRALKFFGDGDSARTQVNNGNLWSLTVVAFCAEMERRFDEMQLEQQCND